MSIDWTYWPSDPLWSDSSYWDYRPPWVRPARPGSMRWALQQTTGPAIEPISLAEAKAHLRVDISDDDALIQDAITAARDFVERMTGLSLLAQSWKLYLDRFPPLDRYTTWPWTAPPATILLPRSPVQSVTSIQWFDTTGGTNTVTSTDYLLDVASRIPRITPAATKSWPTSPALIPQNGVVVAFDAGFAGTGKIPFSLRALLLLMMGHLYENREGVVTDIRAAAIELPLSIQTLLGIHRPVQVG